MFYLNENAQRAEIPGLEIGTIEEIDTDSVDWDSLEPDCANCGRSPVKYLVAWLHCSCMAKWNQPKFACDPCTHKHRVCPLCKADGVVKILETL